MEKDIQKFSNFIKICKKQTPDLERDLIDDVNKFIKTKNTAGLSLILQSGYRLNKSQAIKIFNMEKWQANKVIKDSIETLYHSTLKHDILKTVKKMKRIAPVVGWSLATNLTSNSASNTLLECHWHFSDKVLFKDQTYAMEFLQTAQSMYSMCDSNYQYYMASAIKRSVDAIKELYKEELENKLYQANTLTVSKYASVLPSFDDVKKQMQNNFKEFKESDLPPSSQRIFKDIQATYSKIDLDKINITQKLEVELLYDKRLPEVLNQYLVISPEYKETLKSHSVNPDNLLLDSLGQIKSKIEAVWIDIEEQNFKKMKTVNRYLNSK